MDLDVKGLMLRLLEREREYVLEDLENYGCAMAVMFTANGESFLDFPKFDDEQSKVAAYTRLVEEARRQNAVIIVTVNNAFVRTCELGEYKWGGFDGMNSQRCILLTASGSGLAVSSFTQRYEIIDRTVQFGDPEWSTGVELELLPGWPDGLKADVQ